MPRTEKAILNDLAALSTRRTELTAELTETRKRKKMKCGGCGRAFAVKTLTYIQSHWYEEPYGCTDGDRWHRGEGRWKCACGHVNRGYNDKKIEALKDYFGARVDVHDNGR